MSKAKRLVAGSFLSTINFFSVTLVSLFMMPFLISHLGDRMYGLWLLLGSVFGFYGLFDFGLTSAVQRYISRALGADDYEEANSVFNSSLVVLSIIGIVALFISFIIAMAGHFFLKDPSELDLFRKIVIMTGFGLALGFPMRSFYSIFSSHLRYDLTNIVDLVRLVVRTVLIVFFLSRGYKLLTFAFIMVTTDVAGFMACAFISLKVAPYIRFRKKYVRLYQVKKLFHYSVFSFIGRVSANIKLGIDNFVIAGFVGLGSVTLYSVAYRLTSYYMQFISNILSMLMPVFSHFEGQDNYDAIREKFLFTTKISGYFSCLIGGLLVIFGKVFIIRWVGDEYISAYNILLIFIVPFLISLMQSPIGGVLYGISKHKFLAFVSAGEAIVNLALSLILVRYYGIVGVALGTAIPMFIVSAFIRPDYVCKQLKLSTFDYYLRTLRILAVSAALLSVQVLVLRSFIVPKYLNIILLASIVSFVFFVAVFFIGFRKEERGYLMEIARKMF